MIVNKVMFKNGAYNEVHYLKVATLKKNYPNASHQDVIRLVVKPEGQKSFDLFMTPGEAVDISAGLLNAVQDALLDSIPMFHVDELNKKG